MALKARPRSPISLNRVRIDGDVQSAGGDGLGLPPETVERRRDATGGKQRKAHRQHGGDRGGDQETALKVPDGRIDTVGRYRDPRHADGRIADRHGNIEQPFALRRTQIARTARFRPGALRRPPVAMQ